VAKNSAEATIFFPNNLLPVPCAFNRWSLLSLLVFANSQVVFFYLAIAFSKTSIFLNSSRDDCVLNPLVLSGSAFSSLSKDTCPKSEKVTSRRREE
jgi:hypothetical protein